MQQMDESNLYELMQSFLANVADGANGVSIRVDAVIRRLGAFLTQDDFEQLVLTRSSIVLSEVDAGKSIIRSTLAQMVVQAGQEAYDLKTKQYIRQDEPLKWQTESGRPCPDCVDRSSWGTRTYNEWEAVGLPKYGATICGQRCQCVLVRA